MARRLFGLFVALAVVSAPAAFELCQLTCESTGLQSSMSPAAEGHAPHHHMPAHHAACHESGAARRQLSATNRLCGHGTAGTPSIVAGRNSGTAVSLLAAAPSIDATRLVPTRSEISVRASTRRDRAVERVAVPLRV